MGFELALAIVFLLCTAMISGAEASFFSIKHNEKEALLLDKSKRASIIIKLLDRPRTLLATILISANILSIGLVILSTLIIEHFSFSSPGVKFLVDLVIVTFILVLVGEVIPKIYANHFNLTFAGIMAYPMLFLIRLFYPLSYVLSRSTALIETRMQRHSKQVSLDDLKQAIEITSDEQTTVEEKKILKGIINFGNVQVRQAMRSRVDVIAHDITTGFEELKKQINENRYSRLPIYEESLDTVKGILYIKDLIPHLGEKEYKWQDLIREPYIVPPTKKIDDLLREFQQKKVHMAIVVDEYGGTEGIITLEDILEEIVGEIRDEFDDEEIYFTRLDDENFVFDGKTLLNDVVRLMNLEDEVFVSMLGNAETIGGLATELVGKIPKKGTKLTYENLILKIEASDDKRVKQVKVTKAKTNAEE